MRMSSSPGHAAGRSLVPGSFAECCQWVADAHTSGDPDQAIAALCEIYRVLIRGGWVPSNKASTLLRLHAELVDVELSGILSAPRRTG